MKVGLIDVDGHNFPNLCLMKLKRKKSRTAIMRESGSRAILQKRKTLLRRTAEGSRPKKRKISGTITAAGIPTTRTKRRADTAGVSIRTGSV